MVGHLLADPLRALGADLLRDDLLDGGALGVQGLLALGGVDGAGRVDELDAALLVWDLAALLLHHLLHLGVHHHLLHVGALLLVHHGALGLRLLHILHAALCVGDVPAVGLGDGLALLLADGAALLHSHGVIPEVNQIIFKAVMNYEPKIY